MNSIIYERKRNRLCMAVNVRAKIQMSIYIFTVFAWSMAVANAQTVAAGASSGSNMNSLSSSIAVNDAGNIYYPETVQNAIYQMLPSGATTTIACCAGTNNSSLNLPRSVATDVSGNIYVADTGNNRIVKISTAGAASTLSTGSFPLSNPSGISADKNGNVYIVDTGNNRVVEITASGESQVVSTGTFTLNSPSGIYTDTAGDIYIVDTGNSRILEIPTSNVPSVIASGLNNPTSFTLDPSGNAYIAQAGNAAQPASLNSSASVSNGLPAVLVSFNTTDVTISENSQAQVPLTNITITMTPINGFNQTLTLGFLGLPQNAMGSLSSSKVTFDGITPITDVFSFAVINPGQYVVLSKNSKNNFLHQVDNLYALAGIFPLSFLFLLGLRHKNLHLTNKNKPASILALVLLFISLAPTIVGCAGGFPAVATSTAITTTTHTTTYTTTMIATVAGNSNAYQLGSFQTTIHPANQ